MTVKSIMETVLDTAIRTNGKTAGADRLFFF